jgi:DNA-binding response OmpR family regulator
MFDHTAQELKATKALLQRQSADLEQKVRERTQQLLVAQEELVRTAVENKAELKAKYGTAWDDIEQSLKISGGIRTEFNLLEALARNAGHPVGKPALSEQALGRPLARYDRSIDVHVSSIRRKLGTLPDGRTWIQTVLRQGYQLVCE